GQGGGMSCRINEGANVMSTSDHICNGIEALQRFYQAGSEYVQTGGKDFGPVAATLHPQIVMIQADSLPFGGQWHGREGFERSGGPGESHPRAPTDPGVTVSRHRALVI